MLKSVLYLEIIWSFLFYFLFILWETQRNTQNEKFHLFILYSFNKDLFTTYNILPTILCTEIRWLPNSSTLRAQSTEETYTENQAFPGGSAVKNSPAKGSVSGSGRSPGGGNGNPLQYSYLGNPMDCSPPGYSVHGILLLCRKRVRHYLVIKQQQYFIRLLRSDKTDLCFWGIIREGQVWRSPGWNCKLSG